MPPPLYLDEDSSQRRLAAALRARGFDVLSAVEAGMAGRSDEEQFAFAVATARTIVTANRSDFARLHGAWTSTGRHHRGMVIRSRQSTPPEAFAQEMHVVLGLRSSEDMADAILFV